MNQIIEAIQKAETIAIITHNNPDGDGLGAMFGLYFGLAALGKTVYPVSKDIPSKSFECIPGIANLVSDCNVDNIDLIVAVDASEPNRLELYRDDLKFKTINIDHHNSTPEFGFANLIDNMSSSTAELVLDLFIKMKLPISSSCATALLAGIVYDTHGFLNSNTTAHTFNAVSILMLKGARLKPIVKQMLHSKSGPTLNIWGKVLQDIKKYDQNGMIFSFLSHNDIAKYQVDYNNIELADLSNMAKTIAEASFSLLLVEYDINRYRGSLRSDVYKGTNVEDIAKVFNGGGHKLASGFNSEESVESILAKVIQHSSS